MEAPIYIVLLLFSWHVVAIHCALVKDDLPDVTGDEKLWVVLAAGSKSWFNYRHQADVCHAYQVVHSHGVPDEQIIVIMNDDIAFNEENPTPGVIINRPNGTNVYQGIPKDYTKENANNETFVKVLLGEDIPYGSGKTLKSGPNDHIFVYFSDHGAPGLVAFGNQILTALTLNQVILQMHQQKMFKKLLFYVEACESGSMFEGLLPENLDVFATTAANGTTSSYACYFDDARKTFLGDVYSVKWLEDSDSENLQEETLERQYEVVRFETNTSSVCKFGDLSMGGLKVSEFQGKSESTKKLGSIEDDLAQCGRDAVPAPEVPRVILEKQLAAAESYQERKRIQKELYKLMRKRKFLQKVTRKIVDSVTSNHDKTTHLLGVKEPLVNHDCYYKVVDAYHAKCFNLGCNDFALRQLSVFAAMCNRGYDPETILTSIGKVCKHRTLCGAF